MRKQNLIIQKEIDHLITFNKNGLWIKENLDKKQRIITAVKPIDHHLIDVSIFHLDSKSNLIEKINSSKVNINDNKWVLYDASIFSLEEVLKRKKNLRNMRLFQFIIMRK